MARDHARLLVTIWRDDDFTSLSASAQRMFMLLLSQPRLSLCGALDYTPERWAALAEDTDVADVEDAIGQLEDARVVVVDRGAAELVIRTFVRYDGVCKSPNLIQGLWKAWRALFSDAIRSAIVAELPDVAFTEGFGSEKPKGGYEPPAEALDMRGRPSSPNPSPPSRGVSENPSANPSVNGSPTPSPSPSPSPSNNLVEHEPRALTLVAPSTSSPTATGRSSVSEVFEAWQESTGHHKARLDDKRRRVIERALKHYPMEDCLAAVRGWKHSPHHAGQNNTRTVYDEITLLLRDSEHIERFRDLELGALPDAVGQTGTQYRYDPMLLPGATKVRGE